ncbi:MAG: hypothetical protein R2774_10135 [Saprospiraceae bacterium]
MKELKIVLTLFIFATGYSSYGQSVNNECDTIYDFAETLPKYENDIKGLMDYLMADLAPILSDCYKRDDILTASIYLTLTIDKEGKVIDVEFKRIQASEKCKEELKEKLLTMTGWTPGKQGDLAICCKYQWPISCVNWK